jgi:hypothetical protein
VALADLLEVVARLTAIGDPGNEINRSVVLDR